MLIPITIESVTVDGGAFNVREGNHSVELGTTYAWRERFDDFMQVTADYRDVDVTAGWSPANSTTKGWIAGEAASIGKGAAAVKASAPSAYWTDLVDIDGEGVEEDNQFLYDKQRGILYTYRQDNYQCADGTAQNADVLMGIYTQGNAGEQPQGSEWFVVAVEAGQFGEKKAGLFVCRFDANGKPTTCGTSKVKEESGEVEMTIKK